MADETKPQIEKATERDVTAVLIRAMEMADDLDGVVIMYRKKHSVGGGSGYLADSNMTNAVLNWHIDQLKADIMGWSYRADD